MNSRVVDLVQIPDGPTVSLTTYIMLSHVYNSSRKKRRALLYPFTHWYTWGKAV